MIKEEILHKHDEEKSLKEGMRKVEEKLSKAEKEKVRLGERIEQLLSVK